MQTDSENLLLSPLHIAERMSISLRQVHRLIAAGTIPSLKLGRLRRVRASALNAMLLQKEAGADG